MEHACGGMKTANVMSQLHVLLECVILCNVPPKTCEVGRQHRSPGEASCGCLSVVLTFIVCFTLAIVSCSPGKDRVPILTYVFTLDFFTKRHETTHTRH